jgi:hypothetical protein
MSDPQSCTSGAFAAAFLQKRLLTERGTCFIYDNITKRIENFYKRCEKTFDWRDSRRGRVDCLSVRTGVGRTRRGSERCGTLPDVFSRQILTHLLL